MSAAWPASVAGFAVESHGKVGSTQDLARAHALRGRSDIVVVADAQTGGRGRLDRSWVSPPGNLYASAVVDVPVAPRLLPACSLAVAVALADAIAAFGPLVRVKWPNDLLLDGRKLAGILLEHHERRLLVGTGVNVATPPPGQPEAATLARAGVRATAADVLTAYLPRLRFWLEAMHREGFEPVRQAWLERAAGLGRPLRVTLAHGILEGHHGGIDATGALLVETAAGPVAVAVGDVELVRTKEAG